MALSRTQWYYLIGAAVLTGVLFFASQDQPQKEGTDVVQAAEETSSFDAQLAAAKAGLDGEMRTRIVELEKQVTTTEGKDTTALTALGKAWDVAGAPGVSAHYFEQVALQFPVEEAWLNTAFRYFDAFKSTDDSLIRAAMVQKAIASYQKVIDMNPSNLNAKTDLGICYAEGTSNPMQGIMMLREVVQTDSTHEYAQFNLGILSVKSGQMEKAVDRFNRVIVINPGNFEAYFLLGRCYAQMGQKDKALASLEKVTAGSKDGQLIEQANNLIHQLNSNL